MIACQKRKVLLFLFFIPAFFINTETQAQAKKISLREALQQVTKEYGTRFVFEPALLEGKTVAYEPGKKKDEKLEDVLKSILYSHNLLFLYIETNYYSIVPKSQIIGNAPVKEAPREQFQVRGVVKDDKDAPVSGVTISIKNGTTGTSSDSKGEYAITVDENAVLVFSHIGFAGQEIAIGKNRVINLTMVPLSTSLEEVVIIGYQGVKRKDLTGAVSSLQGTVLKKAPVTTAAEALTGRIAGVQVTTPDGEPGSDIKIRVRGGGSITQDNSPLYIIDGIAVETGLTGIDPADIESIDVLKDASSTAIYGARGANGVVVVTTKIGKEGKVTLSYNGYLRAKNVSKTLQVLKPLEFVKYMYDKNPATATAAYGNWKDYDSLYGNDGGIDWQQELLGKTAMAQSHNVSLNGGTKTTKYNFSFTNNTEDGLLKNTSFNRNVIRLKLDQKISPRADMTINTSYTISNTKGGGLFGGTNRLRNIIQFAPVAGIAMGDSSLLDVLVDPLAVEGGTLDVLNPIVLQEAEVLSARQRNIFLNGSLRYKLTPLLTLSVSGGIVTDLSRNDFFSDGRTRTAQLRNGPYGSISTSERNRWQNTNTLGFRKTFDRKHELNVLLGNEQIFTKRKDFSAGAEQFPASNLGLANFGQAVYPLRPETYEEKEGLISFFGQAFYGYNGKYLLTASLRSDGSSKFAPENRYGYFPSLAVAWRITREKFMKNVSFVNDLKLRVSYGQAGNNRIENSQFSTQYATGAYAIGTTEQTALYPVSLANPDLKWETTIARNIGLDFGLLNNRITGSVDVYRNSTKNLLIQARIRPESGYTTQYQNIGSTRNTGVEITLSTRNIVSKNFSWSTDFNIAFNRSVVTELFGTSEDYALFSSGAFVTTNDFIVYKGKSMGLIYGYVYDKWYTVDDFNYDATTNTYTLKDNVAYYKSRTAVRPGDLKYKDLDGRLDAQGFPLIEGGVGFDKTVIGNTSPKHTGGINNYFQYKSIDLSVFLNWVYGNDVLNANKIRYTTSYGGNMNNLSLVAGRWTDKNELGQTVTDPVLLAAMNKNATMNRPSNEITEPSSFAVENGSFLRVNNISLGYRMPDGLAKKLHISSCRFYVTGYNLHVFTSYTGYDPEVDSRRSTPLTPGVDYSAYPKARSYVVGLNVVF